MRWWQKVALWLLIISGVVWGTVLFTYVLFPIFVVKDGLTRASGLPFGRLYHNYVQLMAYLQLPWIPKLHMLDFKDSVSGATHFADVRKLFIFDIVVFLITVIPGVRAWRQLAKRRERWQMVRSFQIGAIVPIVLGALMAVNFNAVFIKFHEVLFRNDDWLFDPAVDPIINVLPEDFFSACFAIALIGFEAVMIYGIWRGRKDARASK
jgi:integral membrane protein (TIGR01906 family)